MANPYGSVLEVNEATPFAASKTTMSDHHHNHHHRWMLSRRVWTSLLCAVWLVSTMYFVSLGHQILDELRKSCCNKTKENDGMTTTTTERVSELTSLWFRSTAMIASKKGNGLMSSSLTSGQQQQESSSSTASLSPSGISILVVHLDGHEHQRVMGEEVARGAQSVLEEQRQQGGEGVGSTRVGGDGDEVQLRTIESTSFTDVLNADAIIIGSPVYSANTHPTVQEWINTWDITADLSMKIGAAFVTAGGISAGEEGTTVSLLRSMMVFRLICVGGDTWEAAFGASAVVYEDPFGGGENSNDGGGDGAWFSDECYKHDSIVHPMFLRKAFDLGARVARVTLTLRKGLY